MPFGVEKLEWCGYLMVKSFENTFIYFTESMNVTGGQTDTQILHDG